MVDWAITMTTDVFLWLDERQKGDLRDALRPPDSRDGPARSPVLVKLKLSHPSNDIPRWRLAY